LILLSLFFFNSITFGNIINHLISERYFNRETEECSQTFGMIKPEMTGYLI